MSIPKLFLVTLGAAAVALAGSSDPIASAKNTAAAAMQASLQKQRESLAKQRTSVRRQPGVKLPDLAGSSAEFIAPLPHLITEANCAPLPTDEVEALISAAAQKQSVQPDLIRAVMRQESAFRPCAVSIKGAQGLMQLMPATAAQFHVLDPFDPTENVQAGTALLKQLLDRYKGDIRLALVAYNAGANRADNPNTDLYPGETQEYVAKIMGELGITPMQSPAADDTDTDADAGAPETADGNSAKTPAVPGQS